MKVSRGAFAVGAALTATVVVAAMASSTATAATPIAAPHSPTPAVLAADNVASLVASRPAYLQASAAESFTQHAVASLGGAQYVSYDRTYAGLPVVGGDFVLVTNNAGQVVANSVAMTHPIGTLSTRPVIAATAATVTSRSQLRSVSKVESTTLVVDALGASAHLAWATTVDGVGSDGYSRLTVYVDAVTGKVIGSQEHVADGTGTAAINGPNPVTLNTTHSGSTFTMQDPTITNLSCQNASNNTTFSGPDDVWGNGSGTDRETGCVDALFTAQTEARMLSTWLGRNAMDGAGGAWPIRVGLDDENAYYDGTQVQVGHNTAGDWIGSLDVVGHEMGHGVDDHTPGGISGSGTQEFVADTFGASSEWFANEPAPYDTPDFTVGEEVNLVGSGPIRYMYNPSIVGDPNCYSSSIPSAEVHAAAGPGDHWFYLLAEGTSPTNGQPTSPTCNSTTVTGLGIQTAIKIMYGAMLMKTTGASYLKYRTWTLTAAKNLTPGNCTDFNTTKAAWDAVSVPAQAGDPTCTSGGGTLTANNPGNQTGTVGTAVSLTLTATGGTTPYTWTATGLPAGLSISSGGVISGTPTTAGTSTVTATVHDSAAHTSPTTFTWTINPSGGGGCSSPGNKVVNGGFESGNTPWTASAGVLGNTSGESAHTGTKYAWLDGYGTTHTDTLSQSVAIPTGCTNSLTFWLHIDTAETTTTTQYDKLTVVVGTTTVATFSNLNKVTGYASHTVPLTGLTGTLTLKFTGTEDSSLQTSFVVDDVSLTSS